MGVLGLAPFIQKAYPEVIKTLPSRLKSLSGKTVVFDGTLITQRLHFAPMPHPHRHVLGWYRIIQELRDCNVHAICVFDGKERNIAKQEEIRRRRHMRRETAARGLFELERLQRLRHLSALLGNWRKLQRGDAKQTTPESFPGSVWSEDPFSPNRSTQLLNEMEPDVEAQTLYQAQNITAQDQWGDFQEQELDAILFQGNYLSQREVAHDLSIHEVTIQHVQDSNDKQTTDTTLPDPTLPADANINALDESINLTDDIASDSSLSTPTVLDLSLQNRDEDIMSTLSLLHLQYEQSVSKLASLPQPDAVVQVSAMSEPETMQATEVQTEYTMSKNQDQLTSEEGKFWEQMAGSSQETDDTEEMELTIQELARKSGALFESYNRRTNPPTVKIYDECREILDAMGVPCIESEGAFEAEALASSLVINGLADYVASEDTDVIVYEAPLIRNISNRTGPLVVISGSDVRSLLQLSRSSFIDFALLLGTDFSSRIKNVGPRRALNFIRSHGSIERILEEEPRYPPRVPAEIYLAQVDLARMIFQTLPPPPSPELLQQGKYDEDKVKSILMRYGLQRAAAREWDYENALSGNFFSDNPAAS